MTLHTFDLDEPDEEAQPVTFAVRGKRKSNGEQFEEEFTTVAALPPAVMNDISMSVIVRDGDAYYQTHAVLRFLRSAIRLEDHERWDALVRDPDRLVRLEKLVEIMHWIVGSLTDRPTGPLPSSQPGSAGTANGSGEPSSGPDTTPEMSEDSPSTTGSTSP